MRTNSTALGLVCFVLPISACAAGPPDTGNADDGAIAEDRAAISVAGARSKNIALLPPSHRAGNFDTAFGSAGTGITRMSFGADDDGAFFGLDTTGSEILAGGWGVGGLGSSRFRVARLTAAGAPDTTFGGTGMVLTGWARSTADYVYAVAVGHQSDGGIVAMGWRDRFKDASANIALARYLPAGSLDEKHFGDDGRSLIDLGGEESIAAGLVLADDSILVAGKRDDGLLVVRATPRGTLDTSFAAPAGYWFTRIGAAAEVRAMALDDAGRVLVAGWFQSSSGQSDMVLARLTADGVLDASFGNSGVVIAGDPAVDERAAAVAVAPGGAIVVAGQAGPEKSRNLQLRRFLADGSADVSFGAQGVVDTVLARHDDQAESMVVFPDGGVLVGANDMADLNHLVPELVRYECDGSIHAALGNGGVLSLDLGQFGVLHTIRRVAPDQLLVGGGDVGMSPGPGTFGVVARLWM